jgi:uncharacterized protein YjbI with pentapeptide repeats
MHAKKNAKPRKLPFSDEQIRAKAYEIWRERMTSYGSPEDDWLKAIHSLQQERARRWRKPIRKLFFRLNQPLIWLEKQVIEPIAEWFDRAAIFKIIEKLSPIIEAVGVLLIPLAVWCSSQLYQVQKDKQEKATRQQEAIKTYLNQLTTTFLDGNIQQNPNLQKVTRSSTLALLQDPNMTGNGKGQVITFLSEIGLITQEKKETQKPAKNPATPILSLSKADLNYATLRDAKLFGAKLFDAKLFGADLRDADLRDADLSYATLRDADLGGAKLFGADLVGAKLNGVFRLGGCFSGCDYSYAKLSGADLSFAKLSNADLGGADLVGAKLGGAKLSNADLGGADLTRMRNFSAKQIKSAKNWESATYNDKRLDDPEISKQLGLEAKP